MLNDAFLAVTEKHSGKLTHWVSYKILHNTVMIQWLGKPDPMKINNQVHAVLSRAQFELNLDSKICTTFVQKCDDRGRAITVNLEFRKFSLTINYRKIFEIWYIMRNKFQRSHQADQKSSLPIKQQGRPLHRQKSIERIWRSHRKRKVIFVVTTKLSICENFEGRPKVGPNVQDFEKGSENFSPARASWIHARPCLL